jgi:hypothetical protein
MPLTKATYSMIDGAPANVLDFGADPTGSSDSAAAIQAAFDSGAKEVIIPTGTFLIGTTANDFISLTATHSGVTFRGAGGVLKMADNTPVLSSKSAIDIEDAQDICITNIRYDGNASNNTENTLSTTGLVTFSAAKRSQRITWCNNIVEAPNNVGCYVNVGSTECLITNNIFRNCFGGAVRIGLPNGSVLASAIVDGNTAVLDENIHPTSPYQDGLMSQRWGGDAIFSNNRLIIRSNITNPPQMLFWLVRARRLIFTGNEVINEKGVGAYGIQGAITDNAEQILISNNNFVSAQGILITDSGGAREIGQLIIDGNHILSYTESGVLVVSTTSLTVDQATISNNIVEYNSGNGISCSVSQSVISGNVVKRSGGSHGIFASGPNSIYSNNTIDMGGSTSRGLEIYASDSVFNGNRVFNYAGTPIREQGSANWNLINANHTKGGTIITIGVNTVSSNNI